MPVVTLSWDRYLYILMGLIFLCFISWSHADLNSVLLRSREIAGRLVYCGHWKKWRKAHRSTSVGAPCQSSSKVTRKTRRATVVESLRWQEAHSYLLPIKVTTISTESTLKKTIPNPLGRKLESWWWWPQTLMLPAMRSACQRTQPNLYAQKTNTFLFPGESGSTVSGNADGVAPASSPFHIWDMHLLCLSLSHRHNWATHLIWNMTWNEIQSLRADTSRCWKHVLGVCQVWVLASPACLPWCHLLWVTSGMGLRSPSRRVQRTHGKMKWSSMLDSQNSSSLGEISSFMRLAFP